MTAQPGSARQMVQVLSKRFLFLYRYFKGSMGPGFLLDPFLVCNHQGPIMSFDDQIGEWERPGLL